MIAQGNKGSGKTAAFTIGTVMRVEASLKKPQVLCIVNTLELVNHISDVYEKLTKFTNIKVANLVETGKWNGCQIVVSTLGTLKDFCNHKTPIDLSGLKVIVLDEVDLFFQDDDHKKALQGLNESVFIKRNTKIQWLLFSTTYPQNVIDEVSKIVKEAATI